MVEFFNQTFKMSGRKLINDCLERERGQKK